MANAAYRVHGGAIHTESQLNEAGTGIEDVHVVPFTIDSGPARGHRGQVKVPHSQWSPETASAALDDEVNRVHAVASLGTQTSR